MDKNTNSKESLLIGIAIGLIIGIPVTFFMYSKVQYNYNEILYVIITSLFILSLLFILVFLFKDTIANFFIKKIESVLEPITKNITEGLGSLLKGKIEETESKLFDAFKIYFSWYTWRQFRNWFLSISITLTAAIAGYFGSILFIKQNELIQKQLSLEEANRRSSFVFLMSNIMDKIDDEVKQNDEGSLSSGLLGRIHALSHVLRPYRYLNDNDALINKPLSPERAQLLIALINNNLSLDTYSKVFKKSIFTKSDLKDITLDSIFLKGINLSNSDLSNSIMNKTNFTEAQLNSAILKKTKLVHCDFTGAYLVGANLSSAKLDSSSFRGVTMINADLRNASLHGVNFEEIKDIDGVIVEKDWFELLDTTYHAYSLDCLKEKYEIRYNKHKKYHQIITK